MWSTQKKSLATILGKSAANGLGEGLGESQA